MVLPPKRERLKIFPFRDTCVTNNRRSNLYVCIHRYTYTIEKLRLAVVIVDMKSLIFTSKGMITKVCSGFPLLSARDHPPIEALERVDPTPPKAKTVSVLIVHRLHK